MMFREPRHSRLRALLLSVALGWLFVSQVTAQAPSETLASFEQDKSVGVTPTSLVQAGHLLYGTTYSGGEHGRGTIFVVKPDAGAKTLYSFTGGEDGGEPSALVADVCGDLFGITSAGVVFRYTPGGALRHLASLPRGSLYGEPVLVRSRTGKIFAAAGNQLFAVRADDRVEVIYTLTVDGHETGIDHLAVASDGELVGSFTARAADTGQEYTALFRYGSRSGLSVYKLEPINGNTVRPQLLTVSPGGTLYGVLGYGGNDSPFFRYDRQGGFATGPNPDVVTGLVSDASGRIYGVRQQWSRDGASVFQLSDALAPTSVLELSEVHTLPEVGALIASNGSLLFARYNYTFPFARIYRYAPGGELRSLGDLNPFPQGRGPGGLVYAADGALYGLTQAGGRDNAGTIFSVTSAAGLQILHQFDGKLEGGEPRGLTLGADGNLYGRTVGGGANAHGTFYRYVLASGQYEVLRAFEAAGQGSGPALIEREPGVFYGLGGPAGQPSSYAWQLLRLTAAGELTALYSFEDVMHDGTSPTTFILGQDGNFYGTTPGLYGPLLPPFLLAGTIFQLTPEGQYTRLATFGDPSQGGDSPGHQPRVLMQAKDGQFYVGLSTLSFLSSTSYTILSFRTDALPPVGFSSFAHVTSLLQTRDGKLYGATSGGREYSEGQPTLFELADDGQGTPVYQLALPADQLFVKEPAPWSLGQLVEAPDGRLVAVFEDWRANQVRSEIFAVAR